jgi:HPt (histidine-containing phosphotransfer) domain-containing protein
MTSTPAQWTPQASVRALQARARLTNLSRCDRLDAALGALAQSALDPQGLLLAAEVAHQILGSAGTFGFSSASAPAAQLEHFFAAGPHDSADQVAAAGWLVELRAALDANPEDFD